MELLYPRPDLWSVRKKSSQCFCVDPTLPRRIDMMLVNSLISNGYQKGRLTRVLGE